MDAGTVSKSWRQIREEAGGKKLSLDCLNFLGEVREKVIHWKQKDNRNEESLRMMTKVGNTFWENGSLSWIRPKAIITLQC